jgi:hypothetical protein
MRRRRLLAEKRAGGIGPLGHIGSARPCLLIRRGLGEAGGRQRADHESEKGDDSPELSHSRSIDGAARPGQAQGKAAWQAGPGSGTGSSRLVFVYRVAPEGGAKTKETAMSTLLIVLLLILLLGGGGYYGHRSYGPAGLGGVVGLVLVVVLILWLLGAIGGAPVSV